MCTLNNLLTRDAYLQHTSFSTKVCEKTQKLHASGAAMASTNTHTTPQTFDIAVLEVGGGAQCKAQHMRSASGLGSLQHKSIPSLFHRRQSNRNLHTPRHKYPVHHPTASSLAAAGDHTYTLLHDGILAHCKLKQLVVESPTHHFRSHNSVTARAARPAAVTTCYQHPLHVTAQAHWAHGAQAQAHTCSTKQAETTLAACRILGRHCIYRHTTHVVKQVAFKADCNAKA